MSPSPDILTVLSIVYPPLKDLKEHFKGKKPNNQEIQMLLQAKMLEKQDSMIIEFIKFSKQTNGVHKKQNEILKTLRDRNGG